MKECRLSVGSLVSIYMEVKVKYFKDNLVRNQFRVTIMRKYVRVFNNVSI